MVDVLNALTARRDRNYAWSAAEDVADEISENTTVVERFLMEAVRQEDVETQPGKDGAVYRLTRQGDMRFASES